jgi:hypothetical protein
MKSWPIVYVVALFVCAYLGVYPELLRPFDTVPGRTLLLGAVVYLVSRDSLLGFLAAVAMARGLERPLSVLPVYTLPDMLQIQTLLTPQTSSAPFFTPSHSFAIDDVFSKYTWF